MRTSLQWVVFGLDATRIAVPLAAVERIVRAAQVTPLPLAPGMVIGVINVAGCVLPVLNVRRKFRLAEREVRPSDHFLIARTGHGSIVLIIDVAYGVLEQSAIAIETAFAADKDREHIGGALVSHDGLVLVHDLDRFLSPDDAQQLDQAMRLEDARRNPAHAL
jgi:purine-binding chemotaxis protein CheW